MLKDILTEEDAATELECAITTVQELARTHVLPGVKLGRSWVFPRAALLNTLNTMAMAQLQKAAPQARAVQTTPTKLRRVPPSLPRLPS